MQVVIGIDPHKASHTAVAIKHESDYPWSTPSGVQRWCGETELASSASPPAHSTRCGRVLDRPAACSRGRSAAVWCRRPTAEAATSGWYVATVPGTGLDDVLLGSTCANALQCWAVGISLGNLGWPRPVVRQPTHGGLERHDVDARPAAVARWGGWRPLRRHLRQRFRLLGRRRRGRLRQRESRRALSSNSGTARRGPSCRARPRVARASLGAILSSVSCASASSCMAVGYTTDAEWEQSHRRRRAVERVQLGDCPRLRRQARPSTSSSVSSASRPPTVGPSAMPVPWHRCRTSSRSSLVQSATRGLSSTGTDRPGRSCRA